jgi:hypothetical protein
VRDLQVSPDVAALLPADLLATLRAGPHPSAYRCANCLGAGDLAAGDATSLVLRRYPRRAVRRVQLTHAGCARSAITVAPDAIADLELSSAGATLVHAGVLGTAALTGGRSRPFLAVDDDDDLVTTDPRSPSDPDRLRPGELVDPVVSHALATGLVLLTSARAEPALVDGWSLRIAPTLLDLVYPRADGRGGVERLPHAIPPAWRAAVRQAGDQVTLLVGRMGLSTATRAEHPHQPAARPRPWEVIRHLAEDCGPDGAWPERRRDGAASELRLPDPPPWVAAPSSPISPAVTFAVLSAVAAGRVAAGRVRVRWIRPC